MDNYLSVYRTIKSLPEKSQFRAMQFFRMATAYREKYINSQEDDALRNGLLEEAKNFVAILLMDDAPQGTLVERLEAQYALTGEISVKEFWKLTQEEFEDLKTRVRL